MLLPSIKPLAVAAAVAATACAMEILAARTVQVVMMNEVEAAAV